MRSPTMSHISAILRTKLLRLQQEHFYLETQAALVIPREDEFEVYSSCQNPRELQECVAEITHVPFHRVLCRIKRMGGGFGGKETRPMQLAALMALSAQKSRRAVRCQLERHQDMMMSGQRHPFLTKFTVGCDASGRIQAVKALVYCSKTSRLTQAQRSSLC